MDIPAFVLSQLPPTPARVLEFGCGDGTLARSLDGAGYDVLAIDPAAPKGPIFRPLKLEELEEDLRFDVVVESRALHHVADLGVALDKVQLLLHPGGRLVVDEFAWDRLDERTADWYHRQRRALAAAGRGEPPGTLAALRDDWESEHVGLHGFDAMRTELDRRFRELHFSWEPYLYRYLDGVASEELERTLIEVGAIQAIGFRYVGEPL